MSKEIPKMKRCPFCGGEPMLNTKGCIGYIDKKGDQRYVLSPYVVQCGYCGCVTYGYEVYEDAIAAWNRREGNMSNLSSDQIINLVNALIGEIEPVGESHTDRDRKDNIHKLIDVLDTFLDDIRSVIPYKDRTEASMKEIGESAYNWWKVNVEGMNEVLEEYR